MKFNVKAPLAAAASLLIASNIYAQDVKIYVDDSLLSSDQPPIVENSRVLVPFRAIFEALGANVEWDAQTKTVKSDKIRLKIGESVIYVDDTPVPLDVPARIVNSRTLVPVRAVSEGLDADVEWDAQTKTVKIIKNSQKVPALKEWELSSENISDDVYIENEGEEELLIQYNIEYPVMGNPQNNEIITKLNEAFLNDAKSIENSIKSGAIYSEVKAEFDELGLDFVYASYDREMDDFSIEDNFVSAVFKSNLSLTESERDEISSLTLDRKAASKLTGAQVLGTDDSKLTKVIQKKFADEIQKGNDDYFEDAEEIISKKALELPFFATHYGITVYAGAGIISSNVTEVDIDMEDIENEGKTELIEIPYSGGSSADNVSGEESNSGSDASGEEPNYSYDVPDEEPDYSERVSDEEIIEFISNTIVPEFAEEVEGGSVTVGNYAYVENTHCIAVTVKKGSVTRKFAVSFDLSEAFMYDDTDNLYITLGF